MPRILLHSCCGPCTLYPLQKLRDDGWLVHAFFFNPFIQPYQEFVKGLKPFNGWLSKKSFPTIVRKNYDPEGFFRQVVFRESHRCRFCYSAHLFTHSKLSFFSTIPVQATVKSLNGSVALRQEPD